MRDTELYQTLSELMAPWEVTAVNITKAAAGRPLGEVAVEVRWRPEVALVCPSCGQAGPGYDARPRRWRHLNTMQWKTFITELFEAFAIQVLKAVRSQVQAQSLTGLSWDQVDRIMERAVARGLDRRSLEGLSYAGIDEKSSGKGHDYVSVLHDVTGRRVLDVVPERTRKDNSSARATRRWSERSTCGRRTRTTGPSISVSTSTHSSSTRSRLVEPGRSRKRSPSSGTIATSPRPGSSSTVGTSGLRTRAWARSSRPPRP